MKPPKLRPNESSKSFKARVKAWERATGKKFPRTFAGKTDEERVLGGAVRNTGLNKPKDYSTNYGDEIKESQAEKARETQAKKSDRQVKDEKKESFLEQAGKTDYSKVPLPTQKTKLQVKNSPRKPSPEWGVKKNNEKLKSGNSKEDKSEAQLKWEKKSKNSPARASGAFSDKQLWEQRKKHKAWLEKRKKDREERRKKRLKSKK
tara:strand:- start:80 stop:694 length:615 start_codon:yes stop_codon:yes gene_type:complete